MSRYLAEEAIVLRVGQFKENDCWVRFFTPGKGVVTGFAFGGCRSRRRFPGCLDVLNYVRFHGTYQKHGYLTLDEGRLLNRFPAIHQETQRLGVAVNCLKFLEAVHIGSLESRSVFLLFLSLLDFLNTKSDVPQFLPVFFRARLAVEHGYCPNLQKCVKCKRFFSAGEKLFFSVEQGVAFCSVCTQSRSMSVLPASTGKKLTAFFRTKPDSWLETDLIDSLDRDLVACLDRFALFHLGLIWDNGFFRQAS